MMDDKKPVHVIGGSLQASFIGWHTLGGWDKTGRIEMYENKIILRWGFIRPKEKIIPIKNIDSFSPKAIFRIGPLAVGNAIEVEYSFGGEPARFSFASKSNSSIELFKIFLKEKVKERKSKKV